jgi:DNA-binding CsgD family transcriptional regulator
MSSTLGQHALAAHPRNLGYAGGCATPRNLWNVDPYARAAARVRAACDAGGESRALRQRVLAELGRAVPFDAYVWPLTDPETSVGTAPLADVPAPLLADLPRLIKLKYLTDINRWTTLDGLIARLRTATEGDLTRSRMWREALRDNGVVDIASAVYRDRFGCWGFLDLWRLAPAEPFTDAEAAFLGSIAPPVTTGLRRSQADAFVPRPARESPRPGPVVLLLSPGLEVLGQTPQAHEYLQLLLPPPEGRAPVPASAYNVAAQLCAVESDVDTNPPYARVSLPDGQWLSLRAARVSGPQPAIAVTIEDASPAERIGLFARALGLSPREFDLLALLPSGADTRALAQQLFVSEHTIQDHLKSIFGKTGTRTRQSLLSRALGT